MKLLEDTTKYRKELLLKHLERSINEMPNKVFDDYELDINAFTYKYLKSEVPVLESNASIIKYTDARIKLQISKWESK